MTTSCTDPKHPFYEEISQIPLVQRRGFFTKDGGQRFRSVSLGEALDFVSAGAPNYVAYPFGTKRMVEYVNGWMAAQNEGHSLEEGNRHDYLFNRFDDRGKVQLPRINHVVCPVEMLGHKRAERIIDLGGRIRCGARTYKTSIDQTGVVSSELTSLCYSIINEPEKFNFPLETVLDRLNVDGRKTAHPFSGFTLAAYVAAWWRQEGEKRLWRKPGITTDPPYKKFSDFVPINPDD